MTKQLGPIIQAERDYWARRDSRRPSDLAPPIKEANQAARTRHDAGGYRLMNIVCGQGGWYLFDSVTGEYISGPFDNWCAANNMHQLLEEEEEANGSTCTG